MKDIQKMLYEIIILSGGYRNNIDSTSRRTF